MALVFLAVFLLDWTTGSPVGQVGPNYFPQPGRFGFPPPPPPLPPNCKPELKTVTREFCRVNIQKDCKTEKKTFNRLAGYEEGECREVEICKFSPSQRSFQSACDKETRKVCEKRPVMEQVSKDIELCVPKPVRECKETEVKEPTLNCKDEEDDKIDEENKVDDEESKL